jgi:hypothetical protein
VADASIRVAMLWFVKIAQGFVRDASSYYVQNMLSFITVEFTVLLANG